MSRNRIAILGAVLAGAALIGIGAARAQDYYSTPRGTPVYDRDAYQREYDRAFDNGTESVIVHPYYDRIERRQMLGRVDGEINPTAYSLSRPVSFSDLDLSNPADRAELRIRIHETAQDVCAELDARVPGLHDRQANRECVRQAARDAMRDVYG